MWSSFQKLILNLSNVLWVRSYELYQLFTLSTKFDARSFLETVLFLPDFYKLNDLLWQEGLIIDFLQKKSADKWVRTVMPFTYNLFSERIVWGIVVRFYIDYVLGPGSKATIFEFSNVAWTLLSTLFVLLVFFLIVTSLYWLAFII